MRGHQPFLYDAVDSQDSRLPQTLFDPKAVTRASFEPQRPRPKHTGPLVNLNQHPDAQVVLSHRSTDYRPLSPRTKRWIGIVRATQLVLRVSQVVSAAGILVLFILFTNVATSITWVFRIAPAVATLHCAYGIYHMSRPAGDRTPASSAAYQLFAGVSDMCVLPIYALGAFVAHTAGSEWTSRLNDPELMQHLVPAAEYTLITSASLHIFSLCLSIWLGLTFRKIALMPPDLNPLEDRFTSRAKHKRKQDSLATTESENSEERWSAPVHSQAQSDGTYETLSHPPSIPFLRTRANSGSSYASRDTRSDLPSRQYQVVPGNHSPRRSVVEGPPRRQSRACSPHQASYTNLSLDEPSQRRPIDGQRDQAAFGSRFTGDHSRVCKFTETWSASDSLIARTQQRNRLTNVAGQKRDSDLRCYEAVDQSYDAYQHCELNSDDEVNDRTGYHFGIGVGKTAHPEPLGSNPPVPSRAKTPYYPTRNSATSDISQGSRGSSHGQGNCTRDDLSPTAPRTATPTPKSDEGEGGLEFYAKPYGQLQPATPPVMIGSGRQVSSGNDYRREFSFTSHGRRNVSGKVVEEGRAG